MRDLLLFGLFAVVAPVIVVHPYVGTLVWTLIGLMNPHRLAWGAARDFPFAMVAAVLTLIGLLLTRDERKIKGGAAAIVLAILVLWTCVTTVFALMPDKAWPMWERVMKILGMTFVMLLVMNTKRQVELLVWTIVVSIGFYGIKGGIFTIVTGGHYMVMGPPGSVMDGNNALGVAFAMVVPLMMHLYQDSKNKSVRRGLLASIVLCAVSILGTYSRGSLLAVCAMGFLLWLRSSTKLLTFSLILLMGLVFVPFMPDTWSERMDTITTYEQDSSAMGRIISWGVAWNLAKDRPLVGGGFEYWGPETSAKYSSVPDFVAVAHSIYFQVLGEHSFLGLGLFLLFWALVWRQCAWIRAKTRERPDLRWAFSLASMMQASLIGYAVGGAFINLAWWDMPYYLFIAIATTQYVVKLALEPNRIDVSKEAPSMNDLRDTRLVGIPQPHQSLAGSKPGAQDLQKET
jgi:putative inorganic carbon (HCO3(-)) transporter